MKNLTAYLETLLSRGKTYFSKADALKEVESSPDAFKSPVARLVNKGRLVSPKRGFYLIIRPEDKPFGAPDPVQWIGPLMKHMQLDYRISLLRAAAFHGSTHQAVMAFQVITSKQVSDLEIGRHRVQFIFQTSAVFNATNRREWLTEIKSQTGFAQIAGVELTLLDTARYFHKAAGLNGAAQIVHDLGGKANPRILAKAAAHYENSSVRRLGYLFDKYGHDRQANALLPFAEKAKSLKALDPSAIPIVKSLGIPNEKSAKWKLVINEVVEIDT